MIEPILTPREKQVLELLKHGLTNKQIGAELHISEHTSKHYVARLLFKYQFRDRREFMLLAAVTVNDKPEPKRKK